MALRRAHRPHNACVVVLEEAFLAPLFAEWHRAGTLRAGRANVPAIVLVVGKKIKVHDPAGEDSVFLSRDGEAPRGASRRSANTKTRDARARARSRLISASIPAPVPALGEDSGADALFGSARTPHNNDAENSELDVLDFDEAWRALLRGAQQVIRPVKPSALRDALRAADAELARRREGGGGRHGGATRSGSFRNESSLGTNPGPRPLRASRLARHSVVDDSNAPTGLPEPPAAARRGGARRRRRRRGRDALGERRASAAEMVEITEEVTTNLSEENPGENLGENLGGIVFGGAPAREEREDETNVARTARLAEETRDGGCVLIVEDNLMNQKVAKVVVKRCGMRSDVANNGREAIDALTRGGRYDAVLMDIQMPVMDGLDATREIRRLEAAGAIPRAPGGGANFIVAVSANATAENHQEGFEAGMDDYITKPIYPTRLRELLMTPRAR